MNRRIEQEIALLRRWFSEVEYREADRWILVPRYPILEGVWDHDAVSVAFQIPPGYPGQKPYSFYVTPRIRLKSGGGPNNCTDSADPPFEGQWWKFSWDVPDWRATADLQSGSNLLNYALTFRDRLDEGA